MYVFRAHFAVHTRDYMMAAAAKSFLSIYNSLLMALRLCTRTHTKRCSFLTLGCLRNYTLRVNYLCNLTKRFVLLLLLLETHEIKDFLQVILHCGS
jgi:hypothetical protein